ncbi:hypothetical protein C2G38_2190375 [Gigaspora rosea]|uniref:Uncharacterized protein n=1 Tax=Gigaspora rosea TaxID=44941 RepID=A0A397V8I9_9GLOM|nr:hypothetical protein C2G38_2190375 [Gigaspora rosea]
MEVFLFKASFDNEKANSDHSQGSSIGIAAEYHEEAFMFDWQSLKKACKLTSEFDEETENEINEFSKSDDIIEEEFEKLVATETTSNANHYCIIVDYDNDQHIVQRCNALGNHRVQELSGTWEVDLQACFYTRDKACLLHTWKVCDRTIQVPCCGLFNYLAITKYDSLSVKSHTDEQAHFICTDCYLMHGGHLHIQPGREKKTVSCQERNEHNNDTTSALKLFIFNNITQTTNVQTTNVQNTNIQSNENEPSTTLKAQAKYLKETTCKDFGEILAYSILNAQFELEQNLSSIEQPESLAEYYNAMLSSLLNIFIGFISVLKEKRRKILARK